MNLNLDCHGAHRSIERPLSLRFPSLRARLNAVLSGPRPNSLSCPAYSEPHPRAARQEWTTPSCGSQFLDREASSTRLTDFGNGISNARSFLPTHNSDTILAVPSIGRRGYNPFKSSESEVPKARAILLSVRSPGSRVPRSKSEMWTSWTPDCSARSICRQPLARRNFLIRSPVAAQMSLAMRPSSG